MKKVIKLTAAFLSAIIMMQSFTTVALAAETPQTQSDSSSTSQTVDELAHGEPGLPETEQGKADAQIVSEVQGKRTENAKTFLMSDGTYLLASYDEPIHYKDGDGTWQDIDNTMSVTNTKLLANAQVMENKAGDTKIKLLKTIKPGNTISLDTGDYSISWGLDGANTATSQIISNQEDSAESHNDQFLKLKKLNNEILYKDALPGIDVQYLISSSKVKENIILNSKDTQKQFTETYQVGDLTAKQKDNKTIELFEKSDTKQENPIYTINAPQMVDANNTASDAISISILQQDAGMLKISVTTDETWINDQSRMFPVSIDPNIWTKQDSKFIRDTFVASGAGYSNVANINNSMGTMYIGNETANYKTCRILLNFTLPQLSKGDMVVDAQLFLAQRSDGLNPSSATMQLNAYKMLDSWDEKTVTWDNSLAKMNRATGNPISDYFIASQATANSFNTWNVTGLVKDWYNGSANNGIVIKAQDEAAMARNVYYASNYPGGQNAYPTMAIRYVNNAGYENYWSYHSQSAGRAGVGSVNDYTGNPVFTAPVMNTTGERAPLDFSITYNGYQSGTHFANGQKGIVYGWGWQSNLSQRVDPTDSSLGSDYKYVFNDEDGTKHYFITDPKNSSKIIDEDGLGLELTSGGTQDEFYTIKYSDGSKETFSGSGYLKKIYDSDNNSLTLSYSGAVLTGITDGAGRYTAIGCSQYNSITSVKGPDGKETRFNYYGGNLTSITYPDEKVIQFTYDTENRLQKAINVDGTYVQYSYYSSSDPSVKNRVSAAAEYSAAGVIGNKVAFTYNNDNTTTFKYIKSGQAEAQAQKESYNFDNAGRTTSVLNMDGSASTYTYKDSTTNDASANKMTAQTATNAPVINLLKDHNAELNNGSWAGSNWGTPGGTFSVDSTTAYLGTKSLKVTQSQASPQRSGAVQTLTNLTPGTTYTLSGYVKTSGVAGGLGANLYVAAFNGSTSLSTINGNGVFETNDGWQRISVTFVVPANTTRVEVYGGLSYANGTAWFDCLQLETGSVANIYNLLENSDFRYSTNYQPDRWSTTNFTSGDGMTNGWVKIFGNSGLNKNICQNVYINKPANSTAFVVSGKSIGTSVPTQKDGRYYAIDVGMYFTDGTSQWDIADFNPDTTGEQFTSNAIAASAANQNKTISRIEYYIIYYKNANNAAFNYLQLNMDESGTAYDYNAATGTLTSSKQNAKNAETYTFTNAKELATATNKNNETYAYTYATANPHRLTAARSNQTGTGLTYGYDANNYGNVTNTKMGTVSTAGVIDTTAPYLESTQGYSSNGNYLLTSSDQRNKTTAYDVNSVTGLTNSVTDPIGNTTNYTYNPQNNLLTAVRAQSSAGTVENAYGYDGADRLNKITHNGFDYTFVRDGYGNTTAINVGTQNLITNTFVTGNGNLLSSTYGNGFQLGYVYDSYDRVTSVSKNSATAYLYTYDARGNLAKLTDKTSGTDFISDFSYDIGDRLIKKSTSDGSEIKYSYDNVDRSTGAAYTFAGQTKTLSFDYGLDNRKHNTNLLSGGKITHGYDTLNREYITDVNATAGQEPTLRAQRSYVNVENNKTTTLVDTYSNYKHVGASDATLSQYHYTYDNNGNILTVTDKSGNVTNYTYDSLNQLIRVDDQKANVSTTYSYDVGGNITETKTYAYTTDTLETSTGNVGYTYGDTNWKDLLTNYNGQGISYDAIGNPLSYRDGMNFTWEGRQLKTAVANGKNLSYTYNSDGIRTSKTIDGVTTKYFLDGSTVLAQQTGSDVLWFLYDSDGTRVGFTYNGTAYYYTKNAQGDVTGIVDSNANAVVEYSYGAWGKLLSTTGTLADTIGKVNPFLYRGYYYDSETGLYYLNSRYYDPQTGRFVSEDELLSPNISMIGNNLFAYCNNNPIRMVDTDGNLAAECTGGSGFSSGNSVAASTKINNPNGLPRTGGEPNSKVKSPNGKQEREYDQDGRAKKDTDYGHANHHPDLKSPHYHDWDWTQPPGKERGPAYNIVPDYNWWAAPAGVGLVIVGTAATAFLVADDATAIGIFDNIGFGATGGLVVKGLQMVSGG